MTLTGRLSPSEFKMTIMIGMQTTIDMTATTDMVTIAGTMETAIAQITDAVATIGMTVAIIATIPAAGFLAK
jgi:hypothetical protein